MGRNRDQPWSYRYYEITLPVAYCRSAELFDHSVMDQPLDWQSSSQSGMSHEESAWSAPTLPRRRLYRPIFTHFVAEARRVVQDHVPPFCTMKLRTARGFRAGHRATSRRAFLALSGKTTRTKRRNEARSIGR